MNRSVKEIGFSLVALLLFMSLLQIDKLSFYLHTYPFFKYFVLVSILVSVIWIVLSVRDYLHRRGIFYYCIQKFRSLAIPRVAKRVIVLVFSVNLMAILLGRSWYPFYDVGMFRWSTKFTDKEKIVHQPKYYYWQQGQYKILDLRKEASFFLAEQFGWGYTEEFTFGAAFHHKGEKENFEFLSQAMKERGVDTLWVGVHSVNFETREVTFDPDICNAVRINQTAKLYYGPIYIPEYQLSRCFEPLK
jgi:hypothetical protein